MRGVENRFSKNLKRKMLRATRGTCFVCGSVLTMATAEPHHIKPVSDGGETTQENCRIVCRPCHVGIHRGEKGEWK